MPFLSLKLIKFNNDSYLVEFYDATAWNKAKEGSYLIFVQLSLT